MEHYRHRNNLIIEIKNDRLRFEDSIIEKNKLSDTLKFSIKNPHDWPDLAEKVVVEIENKGFFESPKVIIDIRSELDIQPEKYSEILTIVKNVFHDLRNEVSISIYEKDYDRLNEKQRLEINKVIPQRIRLEKSIPIPPPPSAHLDSVFYIDEENEQDFENEINKN